MKRLSFAVIGAVALILAVIPPARAQFTANFQTNTVNGVVSNWPGDYLVGSNTFADVLLIQNGGVLSNGAGFVGFLAGSSNNTVVITGASSVWTNQDGLFIGYGGSSNTVTLSAGSLVASNVVISYSPPAGGVASNNLLRVDGGSLVVTNAAGTSLLVAGRAGGRGTFLLNGGAAIVDSLVATNSTNSVVILNRGTLTTRSILFGSGAVAQFELGTNAAAAVVTTNLTLNGLLRITDGGGFTNATYTLYRYRGTLTTNGSPTILSIDTTPTPNFSYTVDLSSNGLVRLVTAFAVPTAQFSATPTNGTAPLLVTFTDSSVGSITNRTWNLGDGTIVSTTETNLTHTYNCTGHFNVSLAVAGVGGSNSLVQTNLVSVTDTNPPVITACVPAVTNAAGLGCQAPVPDLAASVLATDNCTASNLLLKTQTPAAGTMVAVGTTEVTVTVRDASSNAAECVTQLVVADLTPPTILSCAAAVTNTANPNGLTAVPQLAASLPATDNCTQSNFLVRSQSPVVGTMVGVGTTNILISIQDTAANVATCVTTLTVIDLTPPTILACAPALTNPTTAGCQGVVPDFTAAVQATDNSTPSNLLTRTQTPVAGTLVPAGTTPVTITIRDASSNATPCTTSLVIRDQTAPTVVACPPPVVVFADGAAQGTVPSFLAQVGATDNCTASNLLIASQSPVASTVVGVGVTTVTISVTDAAGNVGTCETTFNVLALPVGAGFVGSPTTGRVPLAVSFVNSSTGTFLQSSWTFGDGGTSTANHPTHTYTNVGTFSVSLTVSGPGGTDTVTRAGYIHVDATLPPVLTSNPAVSNAFLQLGDLPVVLVDATNLFVVTAADPGGNSLSYQWSFGDGVTSPWSGLSTAAHAYSGDCGPVVARVAVSNGWTAPATRDLTVAVACALDLTKFQGTLNFAKPDADSCSLKGTFNLPADYSFAGKTATLDVGGAQIAFALGDNGSGNNGASKFKAALNKKTGAWSFSATLKNAALQEAWANHGMTDADVPKPGQAVQGFPVVLVIDHEAFVGTADFHYTAKAGKSGKAK